MSQIYNDNTKRPKPKENQLGILGISSLELLHSAEGLRSRREYRWVFVSIFESTPKGCCISPLKVAATLLSGSGKGVVGA